MAHAFKLAVAAAAKRFSSPMEPARHGAFDTGVRKGVHVNGKMKLPILSTRIVDNAGSGVAHRRRRREIIQLRMGCDRIRYSPRYRACEEFLRVAGQLIVNDYWRAAIEAEL